MAFAHTVAQCAASPRVGLRIHHRNQHLPNLRNVHYRSSLVASRLHTRGSRKKPEHGYVYRRISKHQDDS